MLKKKKKEKKKNLGPFPQMEEVEILVVLSCGYVQLFSGTVDDSCFAWRPLRRNDTNSWTLPGAWGLLVLFFLFCFFLFFNLFIYIYIYVLYTNIMLGLNMNIVFPGVGLVYLAIE